MWQKGTSVSVSFVKHNTCHWRITCIYLQHDIQSFLSITQLKNRLHCGLNSCHLFHKFFKVSAAIRFTTMKLKINRFCRQSSVWYILMFCLHWNIRISSFMKNIWSEWIKCDVLLWKRTFRYFTFLFPLWKLGYPSVLSMKLWL